MTSVEISSRYTDTSAEIMTQGSKNKAATTDEGLLISKAKAGCSSAFGELYERHRPRLYRTVLRILGNHEDAEDAVQRGFQRAFMTLTRFRQDSSFSTWMTRIAINEALMLLRHRRANNKVLSESNGNTDQSDFVLDIPDARPTPEQSLTQTELRTAVIRAISGLRSSLRIVVHLRDLQGLSSAETARRLGLTVGAVKARSFYAKRHLRRHFERKYQQTLGSFLMGVLNKKKASGSNEEASVA
jgi:RNA polymerase sigma-70 factor, ECF subfamily